MRCFWLAVTGALLAGPAPGWAAPGSADRRDERPNIVFLLADDLGWTDLACYGSTFHETPHLDALARQGVRFTQATSMSVCSPTRSAIMTGKHAARLGMTIWREGSFREPEPDSPQKLREAAAIHDLPHAEVTLAEILQARGYRTFHVGKWHLGDAAFYPETQGFEVNVGGTHWGAPASFFWPFRGSNRFRELRYVPGLGLGRPGDYLTDRLADEAIRCIDQAGDEPFFLNLWFHSPHTPIEGKPELVAKYQARVKPGLSHRNPGYAAMVHSLDDNVGRVLKHLEQRGLAARTLVVFTSDNGGYINEFQGMPVTSNLPLRSGKGSLYEGGIRVPLIVRLPGTTSGGGECPAPVTCMDYFRTIAELTGADGSSGIDGVSLVPWLKEPAKPAAARDLHFHYPHYYPTTTPVSAIRSGPWKLLEYFEDGRRELFHLEEDPGEKHDRSAAEPQRTAELARRLQDWRAEVHAPLPRPRR